MISELHESGYRGKLWRHTTLKHVKALYSKNPNILRKSGGAPRKLFQIMKKINLM